MRKENIKKAIQIVKELKQDESIFYKILDADLFDNTMVRHWYFWKKYISNDIEDELAFLDTWYTTPLFWHTISFGKMKRRAIKYLERKLKEVEKNEL